MAGRPPLPIGAHGEIRIRPFGDKHRARTLFRDNDGVTRQVERVGPSKTAARNALLAALAERRGPTGEEVTRESRLRDVAQLWLAELQRAADAGTRSPSTVRLYRSALKVHVLPELGGLRLREVTVMRCDRCLGQIESRNSARTARSALSGLLGFATRNGAMTTNPVRDVGRIEVSVRRPPRAMTAEERRRWLAALEADEDAVRHDLPDLTRFLLATGLRISEALAVTFADIDLATREMRADWQITRVRGQGLVRRRRKGERGERVSAVLRLPQWAVAMLRRRRLALGLGPVFPDSLGGWRDPSNTSRCVREARARLSKRAREAGEPTWEWMTSHVLRKTVATDLDDAGVPTRVISDQLNHSQVSMTQNRYLGRRAVSDVAASVLDAMDPDQAQPS